MIRCFLLIAFITQIALCAPAAPLDPMLGDPKLWTWSPTEFEAAAKGLGFEWVSASRDSARSTGPALKIFGQPVVEAVARFESEKLKEITVAIYARGDAGDLGKDQYAALISGTIKAVDSATGLTFTPRGKDATNLVRADGVFWQTAQARYLLEYSSVKEVKSRSIPFRAEFVRMEITPPEKKRTLFEQARTPQPAAALGSRSSPLQDRVKKRPNGDVLLENVPMVDQGDKGYCVVASTERVVRYFGGQVDANELAQIGNSTAEGGTSTTGMFTALKKVAPRLKVRVKQLEETDVRGVLALIKDYNRVAKKMDATEIDDPGRMIDVAGIYRLMQLDVLKAARMSSRADAGKFQRQIQAQIDGGVPLLWSVQLGIVKEPGIPQNAGGHMRLIIGYNTEKKELIFSDSWGAGHEEKRMPMDDAWTITTGLASIEPL
ncbi:MAG TPA: C39 family peptidase [Chthoniobacteraceae bacterium]|jgi:hypothetical protein